jgi:hypothetical protein
MHSLRQWQAEAIDRLCARLLFQLLEEIDRDHGLGVDVMRHAAFDPDTRRWLGGDRLPETPSYVIDPDDG